MLVLGRFVGQSFDIYLNDGSKINIKVLSNQLRRGGKICSMIGIDAPKNLNVVREELLPKNLKKI